MILNDGHSKLTTLSFQDRFFVCFGRTFGRLARSPNLWVHIFIQVMSWVPTEQEHTRATAARCKQRSSKKRNPSRDNYMEINGVSLGCCIVHLPRPDINIVWQKCCTSSCPGHLLSQYGIQKHSRMLWWSLFGLDVFYIGRYRLQ